MLRLLLVRKPLMSWVCSFFIVTSFALSIDQFDQLNVITATLPPCLCGERMMRARRSAMRAASSEFGQAQCHLQLLIIVYSYKLHGTSCPISMKSDVIRNSGNTFWHPPMVAAQDSPQFIHPPMLSAEDAPWTTSTHVTSRGEKPVQPVPPSSYVAFG